MRPVTRGPAPRSYREYGDAIGDLEQRLGLYCSYCERRLPTGLAVEHVSPKSLAPAHELLWDNFLLGCSNCNSVKSNRPTNNDDFLWPDRDNTLRAVAYSEGGLVSVITDLDAAVSSKASELIDIVGLDRSGSDGAARPAPRDKRWLQRRDAWALATQWKARIATFSDEARAVSVELIRDLVLGYGFFSVWMTVFADDREIRRALVAAFSGTARDCFDPDANLVPRPSGRL